MPVNYKKVEDDFDITVDHELKSNVSIRIGGKDHYLIGTDKKGRELYLHGGCLLIIETRTAG